MDHCTTCVDSTRLNGPFSFKGGYQQREGGYQQRSYHNSGSYQQGGGGGGYQQRQPREDGQGWGRGSRGGDGASQGW